MALQQQHPIFDDIVRGNLEEVQRRVRADAAVLEERGYDERTPLMYASRGKPAIALWLIEQRGQTTWTLRVRVGRRRSTSPPGQARGRSWRRWCGQAPTRRP